MTDQTLTPTGLLLWRVAAWAGPAFIVGLLLFWGVVAGYIPAPPQDWTAAEITAKYTDQNTAVKVGMVGTLFCAPLYFVWSSLVSRVMQRIEGPSGVLSNVELLGGATTTVVAQLFPACWLAAAFRIDARTPQDVQLMHDLGWMFFNMTFVVTLVQMVALGTAVLVDPRRRPLFPRWVGWFSYGTAATFLCVLLMPFVLDGPFAWNGLLTYWLALSAYFAWAAVAMSLMFPAIRRIADEDGVAARTSPPAVSTAAGVA